MMTGKCRYFVLLLIFLAILPSCGGEKVKPNILLITIDTLRRDHVSCYGYPRETTPFIDGLAKEGSMFKHVLTPQPQTSGSHASILTSLHPLTHDVLFNGFSLNDNVRTIAEVLKKDGYYTIGAVAVKILSRKFNFSRGFDSFSDRWKKNSKFKFVGNHQRIAPWVNESLFEQIRRYLSRHSSKPLFIWVHYYDPHQPYIGRDHITFKNKLPDDRETNKKIKRYDQEIRYTDDAVRELYKFLEEKGISKRLVTCITADHGEQFGEHGLMDGHNDFYTETTQVPLVFHGYGVPAGKVIDKYVSVMDIAVTLLGRVNLSFDYPTEGIDLLAPGRRGQGAGRKFLIIGTQRWTRSLQLVGDPFAFILNLDHHCKYWYIPTRNNSDNRLPIDENRFKPIHKKHIKKVGNKTIVSLPPLKGKGFSYAVLRGDLHAEKNKPYSVIVKMEAFPGVFSKRETVRIKPGPQGKIKRQTQTIEVVYPVTMVDRIHVHLYLKGKKAGAVLDNPRYAFIPAKEFPRDREKIYNLIWGILLTRRKGKNKDEFYDLAGDTGMQKNLLDTDTGAFKPIVVEYKKLIYKAYKYYNERKHKVLKGTKTGKQFSEEDRKILKSLGYF